jgi:hypothetical protein
MGEGAKRGIVAALALAALPLLATFAPPGLFTEAELPGETVLSFEAVPLDRDAANRHSIGKLLYLGGWQIRSNDRRFGGISAIHVERGKVIAISDAGSLIRFSLPGGSSSPQISPLSGEPGSQSSKSDRDSESMVVHGRRAWIGFERRNLVGRYRLGSWTSDASAAPPAMKSWPGNSGSEAMVRLANGSFLIFSEGKPRPGGTEVLLFEGDPALPGTRSRSLTYRPPEGYRITDAALLPDGRLLFLNRRFSLPEGFTAKLTIGSKPKLEEGAILEGEEIAHLQAPVTVDNMEGLSVASESGRTILWIASDDNLNPLQRTLLLKFALVE